MYKNDQIFLKKRYDPVLNRTIHYNSDARPRLEAMLSFVKRIDGPIKLLDIGCYDGYIAMLLKEKIGNECDVYGIDTANNSIKLSRKKGIHAKICDVTKGIKYASNLFDYVFAGEIIEHLVDTDYFMREIRRVLKPDGILILTTPNSLSLGRRIHYLFGKGTFLEISFSIPKNAAGHLRYFTFGTMREFIILHKFEEITMFSDTVNFPGFKIDLLAKIFPTLGQSIIAFLRNKK